MKKATEPFPTGKYDNSEVSRRLYRGAVEAARRLEDLLRSSSQQDILGPDITSYRMRLKDYCERLMFSDPSEYGRKAEELMWRKVYYDILQMYKLQRKNNQVALPDTELQNCLMAGIGNYHHLLLRLQAEFHLDLECKVEAPFLWHQKGLKKERWKKYRRSVQVQNKSLVWAEQMCHRFLLCLGDLSRYLFDTGDLESRFLSERYYRQAFCLSPNLGMPLNQLATLSGMKNYGCDALYYYMRCLLSPQSFDGVEGNIIRLFEKNNETFREVDTSDDEAITSIGRRFSARFLKLCEHFYLQKDESLQLLCQDVLRDFDICLTLDSKDSPFQECKVPAIDKAVVFKVVVVALAFFSRLQEQGSPIVSASAAFTLTLLSHVVRHCLKSLCHDFFAKQLEAQPNFSPVLNSSEPGTRSTSGTVTPTMTTVPIENNEKNLNGESLFELNNLPKNDRKELKKLGKSKMSHHLRKARRRRNSSVTSQEDSDVDLPESSDLDEDEEKWSSDEHGRVASDISETGSSDDESEEEIDFPVHEDKTNTEIITNGVHKIEIDQSAPNIMVTAPNSQNATPTHNNYHVPQLNDHLPLLKLENCNIELSPLEVYSLIEKESLLAAVKVLSDWLRTHSDIISACADSSKPLWYRFVDLLNVLLKTEAKLLLVKEPQQSKLRSLKCPKSSCKWFQPSPLPEDEELQKMPPLAKAHDAFKGKDKKALSKIDQVFLRVQCLLHFGFVLTNSAKTGVHFNEEKNKFEVNYKKKGTNPSTPTQTSINGSATSENNNVSGGALEIQRKQLMRNMAHLWLKAEVSDLEVEKRKASSPHLSPYLVPDTGVLCHHLPSLKQLETAKRFIVILPTIVISNLDFLKKESLGAREAIRWIETELRRGTRFLRAQKSHEHLSLVPMKYPKKKDKEAWDFFQILECCNFLSQQNSSGRDPAVPLVTLVTGGNQMPPSASAIAKSTGVNMEPIEELMSKWRSSSKSQG